MADLDTDVQIDEKIKIDITEPKKYKVIFLDDDKTPIEFVIDLLKTVFKHTEESAQQITLTVHTEGSGVAGVYVYEIAEQRTLESTQMARAAGFPLQVKLEKE